MPLHIGVDAWNLTGDRRGIGRYVREILARWASWRPHRVRLALLVPEQWTWFARRRYLTAIGNLDLAVRYRGAHNRDLDAVWYPWNGMSWVTSRPSIATLHDASLFSLPPDDANIREREQRPFRVAAAHARRIITDSQFSKEELVRHLHLDPDVIDVIHLGVGEAFFQNSRRASQSRERQYVLFVGEPERRKGLVTLLHAMELLPRELRDQTELVIAGASGEYPLPPGRDSMRMTNLGHVDDDALASLYARAAVLAHPSEYEGFGLPVLEAMASGTPVVASDVPSVREVGADAALYVPAGDARALASAVESVLTNPSVAGCLRALGRRRAREMTWEAAAEKTLAAVERAVGEPVRG